MTQNLRCRSPAKGANFHQDLTGANLCVRSEGRADLRGARLDQARLSQPATTRRHAGLKVTIATRVPSAPVPTLSGKYSARRPAWDGSWRVADARVHLSGADLRGASEEPSPLGGDLRGARFAGALDGTPAASGTPTRKAADFAADLRGSRSGPGLAQ